MNAAQRRVAGLLERWQASVERHAGYLELDDASYAKAQKWPHHQRPSRWVVELAHSRLRELRRQLEERTAKGDTAFAESLELMGLLTALLGSEHVERFVPYAMPAADDAGAADVPRTPRKAAPAPAQAAAPAQAPARQTTVGRPVVAKPAVPATRQAKMDKPPKPDAVVVTVITDAARLLSWGREWPQLAGLIARLSDRPPEKEVWSILRAYRTTIEQKARRVPD